MADFIQYPNYFGENLSNLAGGLSQGQKSVQDMRMLAAQPQAQQDIYTQFISGAPNFAQVAGSLAKMGNYQAGVDMLKTNANQGNDNLAASYRTAQAVYNTAVNTARNASEAFTANPGSTDASTALQNANIDVAKAKRNYELAYNAWAEASNLPPIEVSSGMIQTSGNKDGGELTAEQKQLQADKVETDRQTKLAEEIKSKISTYKNIGEVETALKTAGVTQSPIITDVKDAFNTSKKQAGDLTQQQQEALARQKQLEADDRNAADSIATSTKFKDYVDIDRVNALSRLKTSLSKLKPGQLWDNTDEEMVGNALSQLRGQRKADGSLDGSQAFNIGNAIGNKIKSYLGAKGELSDEALKRLAEAVNEEILLYKGQVDDAYGRAIDQAGKSEGIKRALNGMLPKTISQWNYTPSGTSSTSQYKEGDTKKNAQGFDMIFTGGKWRIK